MYNDVINRNKLDGASIFSQRSTSGRRVTCTEVGAATSKACVRPASTAARVTSTSTSQSAATTTNASARAVATAMRWARAVSSVSHIQSQTNCDRAVQNKLSILNFLKLAVVSQESWVTIAR